jgi:hypothetical protein
VVQLHEEAGQRERECLPLIERALIQYFLAEAHDLVGIICVVRQEMVIPLSTGHTSHVTIRDSSDARNTAELAISSGSIKPIRCAAANFRHSRRATAGVCRCAFRCQ